MGTTGNRSSIVATRTRESLRELDKLLLEIEENDSGTEVVHKATMEVNLITSGLLRLRQINAGIAAAVYPIYEARLKARFEEEQTRKEQREKTANSTTERTGRDAISEAGRE